MAQDELGQSGKALGKKGVQLVDVVHGVLPAVLFTEIHRGAALLQGLAMP